jgi:hypothetical protein
MSGNRNQDQVQPDCGDAAKANSHAHRETKVTAPVLDSTPNFTHHHQKRRTNGANLCNSLVTTGRTLASRQPYFMNRRNDSFRMLGWHFVAAVNNDLPATGRETSQVRL